MYEVSYIAHIAAIMGQDRETLISGNGPINWPIYAEIYDGSVYRSRLRLEPALRLKKLT
jgi:hypothetical protein